MQLFFEFIKWKEGTQLAELILVLPASDPEITESVMILSHSQETK